MFVNMKENSLTPVTTVEKATMQRATMIITSVCTKAGDMDALSVKEYSE